jgi:hypothetical protein
MGTLALRMEYVAKCLIILRRRRSAIRRIGKICEDRREEVVCCKNVKIGVLWYK